MDIKAFTDKVLLPEKRDVLRVHLYFKMVQYGIRPYENDIDIILELYMFGGYRNAAEQSSFIKLCLEKGLKKSAQSVRNTLSKYVGMGIFDKPKNASLNLNEKFIPIVQCDRLMLQHVISHAS
jgi:hypothetical protein